MTKQDTHESAFNGADDVATVGSITTDTKGAPPGSKPDLIPQDYVGSGIAAD